jgi:pimeloyl-[acyl-carrier protein] methyl ester esterase
MMHVEVSGHGTDLVLLHGWGMTAQVWVELATHLAPQFRVHRVDLPGYRRSSSITPYTLDAISDALAAICAPRATVCGWSLGGQLAIHWALRNPGQVERLVLIACTPHFVRAPDWQSGIEPAVFDAFVQALAHDPQEVLRRFSLLQAQGDVDARTVTRRLRECVATNGEFDIAALAAGLQLLKNTDLRAELPGITQPVLIFHGEHDTVVAPGAAEYMQRTIAQATLTMIAGAAHAPFITQPQEIARRIAEFCYE